MRLLLAPLLLAVSLPAFAQGKPKTYKECIKNASDITSKWVEYKADVNTTDHQFSEVTARYFCRQWVSAFTPQVRGINESH